jgi:hypothetical protein
MLLLHVVLQTLQPKKLGIEGHSAVRTPGKAQGEGNSLRSTSAELQWATTSDSTGFH